MSGVTDKEKIQQVMAKLEVLSSKVDSLSTSAKETAEYIDKSRMEIKARQSY